jgi:hypothetical protein
MTGVLVLSSAGLILAETCESYPNGWTFAGSDSAGLVSNKVHGGSHAFRTKTTMLAWNNWPNGWASGDYHSLSKTVDVKSGANRIGRIFRGPSPACSIFDDFNDGLLDQTLWTANTSISFSGSVITVLFYTLNTSDHVRIRKPCKVVTRFKIDDNTKGGVVRLPDQGDLNCIELNFQNDGILWIRVARGGNDYAHQNMGSYDTAMHAWEVEWTGQTKIWRDGVLFFSLGDAPDDNDWNNAYIAFRTINNGSISVDYVGIGAATGGPTGVHKFSLKVGTTTVFDIDVRTDSETLSNDFFDSGWVNFGAAATGSQTVELKLHNASVSRAECIAAYCWDDLILMVDSKMVVHGMLGGQKIELYDSGGSLRKQGTCPQTGVDVELTGIDDLIPTANGFSGYFKVYDTDSVSLLYTTPTATRWGGDEYTWIPNQSAMDILTEHTLIYRTGSGLLPTQTNVTITLKDKDSGTPLEGKTILWTPNLGTCDPESGQTDENGQASTTFTAGANPGFAGVLAEFDGDATYGLSSIIQAIDIYYAQPVPGAAKDFQVWIAGQEAAIAGGNYKLSSDFKPQSFSFTTPLMSLTVGGWWPVEIYRKGVVEFVGRIFGRKRQGGPSPQLTVTGVDEIIMVQRRVANKGYTDEPKLIIEDLLTRYPCGISAGTIATYGAVIKLDATYENLYDALMQIAKVTGWKFRLNANRTLDFGSSFGTTRDITITLGENLAQSTHEEDWSQIDTKVYVIGAAAGAALVSTAEDPTGKLVYGLIEEPFLEKNISEQGTLDLRAQEIIAQHQGVKETVAVDWIDTLSPGAYAPHDSLTVTDPETGISGLYSVKSITRDLTDANKSALELANRLDTIADALQSIRKDVKDLAVA